MNKVQALDEFWNSFEWIAYDENSVPDNAQLPYITYEVITSDFGKSLTLTASLWEKSNSWKTIQEKEMEIANFIGRGGRLITYDDGAFWVRKSDNWAQRMDSGSELVRRIILNIMIEYID